MLHYRIRGKFPPHPYPDESQHVSYFCVSSYKIEFYISLAQYTASCQHWNIWRVVSYNTALYLWNIPSIVKVWQRKQYFCFTHSSCDLEGQRLILTLIEGAERERSTEISHSRRVKLQQMLISCWFSKGIALLYLQAARCCARNSWRNSTFWKRKSISSFIKT